MALSAAGGCGSVPAACPRAQVALDVIEELCCEMGLQHPEAFDEYILFVVTDRGEGLAGTGRPCRRRVPRVAAALRLPGRRRAERAAADPPGVRPGCGHRDGAPGRQLHLLVPPRGLEPAPQVRQRALRHRPLQPGRATLPDSPRATSLSPPPGACPIPKPCPCALSPPRFSPTTSRGCSPSCRPRGRESSTSRTWPSWPPSSTEPRTATTSPPRTAGSRGEPVGDTSHGVRDPLASAGADLRLPAGGRCRTTSPRSSSAC